MKLIKPVLMIAIICFCLFIVPASYALDYIDAVTITFPNEVSSFIQNHSDAYFNVEIAAQDEAYLEYNISWTNGIITGHRTVATQSGITNNFNISLTDFPKGVHDLVVTVTAPDASTKTVSQRIALIDTYTPGYLDEYSRIGIHAQLPTYLQSFIQGNLKDVETIKLAGIRNVRPSQAVVWNNVEKKQGIYDFSSNLSIGTYKNQLLNAGINFTLCGMMAPTSSGTFYTDDGMPVEKRAVDAYINYASAVMNNVSDVDVYEIWNEPNLQQFWCGDSFSGDKSNGVEYSNLVRAAIPALEKNFPNINILGGVASNLGADFLRNVLSQDTSQVFTGYSFHPYFNASYPDEDSNNSYKSRLADFVSINGENGGWMKVYVSEVGWTRKDTLDEYKQASYLTKVYIINDYHGVDRTNWYIYRNPSPDNNGATGYGLISNDFKPMAGYAAMAQLTKRLNSAIFICKVNLGSSYDASLYLCENEPMLIAWAKDGTSSNVSLESNITVEDLYGNAVSTNNGVVTLSENPTYISGLSHKYAALEIKNSLLSSCAAFETKWSESLMPVKELCVYTDVPTKANIIGLANAIKNIGNGLIYDYDNSMELKDLSLMLYELNQMSKMLIPLFSLTEDTTYTPSSQSAITDLKNSITEKTNSNAYTRLVYTQRIANFAIDYSERAYSIAAKEDNSYKNGLVYGYDKLAEIVCSWATGIKDIENVSKKNAVLTYYDTSNNLINKEKETNILFTIENRTGELLQGNLYVTDEGGRMVSEELPINLQNDFHNIYSIPVKAAANGKYGNQIYNAVISCNGLEVIRKLPITVKLYPPAYSLKTVGNEDVANVSKLPQTKADNAARENYFELEGIDDRGYYLLDITADGKYFVMTDESYGKAAWDTQTVYEGQGNIPNLDVGVSTNIMYKLNEFLYKGKTLVGETTQNTTDGYIILDETIRTNIVEDTEWICFGDYGDGPLPFYITAPIAVMDLDELIQYRTKFGNVVALPAGRTLTRAGNSLLRRARYRDNPDITQCMNVRAGGAYAGAYIVGEYTAMSEIRPCFYLNSDFFKKVQISLENSGSQVIRASYSRKQLSDIGYTSAELLALGYTNEDVSANNITVNRVGQTLIGDYEYHNKNITAQEVGTKFAWYSSDLYNGTYTIISGAKKLTYDIQPEDMNKFIKLGISVADSNGTIVEEFFSDPIQIVPNNTVAIKSLDRTSKTAIFDIESQYGGDIYLIVAVYSVEGKLMSTQLEKVELNAGETAEDINLSVSYSLNDNDTIKAMAFEVASLQPLCNSLEQ